MEDPVVVKTLASILAARTGWAWRPAGPVYTSSEVGVFYGSIGATPDRAVGLVLYGDSDDVETGLSSRRIQVRFRGAANDVDGADELASLAFTAIHGLVRTSGLCLVSRVLVAPLGTDDNGRQERADSYKVIIDNPEV